MGRLVGLPMTILIYINIYHKVKETRRGGEVSFQKKII